VQDASPFVLRRLNYTIGLRDQQILRPIAAEKRAPPPPCLAHWDQLRFITMTVALRASGWRRELDMSSSVEESDGGVVRPVELELTVLMPCLNEAETIGACIRKAQAFLARKGVAGEVLVADNGSTDKSPEIARQHGARLVNAATRGYGAALLGGIEAARGRYIVMGDADDSYDFSGIDEYLDQLRCGADLVMGNRFRGGIDPGAMPFIHRYLGNPALSFLGRLFFRIPVGDFHCGLRAFKTESIRSLRLQATGMEFASEMIVRSALRGLKIVEVPTPLKPDGRSRAPHLKTWRDGWRHLKFLLMYSPRWLFFIPGFSMIAIGLLLAATLFFGPVKVFGDVILDIDSFISACFLVIVGVQFLSFGVLSRSYAAIAGYLSRNTGSMTVLRHFTTDRLALGGVLLVAAGAATFSAALYVWALRGFGRLPEPSIPRIVLGGMTVIVIGFQVLATGFLLGIFEIPRSPDRRPRSPIADENL
jgi:glycosyltransferase involved in cell wall biosynthesis